MDVLNNFWELMTTENEILTKIVTTLPVLLETYLVFKLLAYTLQLNYNKTQQLTYMFLFAIVSTFCKFTIPSPFNTFINYFTMFIIVKLIFKTSPLKTLLAVIIPTIVFALISTLILNPFLKLMNISTEQLNTIPIIGLAYLFILYFFVFMIIELLKIKKMHFKLIDNLTKSNKLLIFFNLFLGIITLCTQALLTYYYISISPLFINILNLILLLSYFVISLYSLTKTMQLQNKEVELQNAETYNATLSILYDNVKAFKHDFDNMVFTIGGFVNTNDIDGLKKYYTSLEKECQSVNNVSLLNPILINNPGIYNLLTAKYQKAKKQNVEIQLDFFFDLSKLHMPIYEFSRMLGIFLDNAIEAASDSNEKIIKIMFRDSSKSCVQIIQIENSYTNKSVNTKLIFEKGVTEKENHQGMGLWEVRKILKHKNNINLITENNDEFFKQCLEIYY